ncbi:protein FAM180A [Melanotaenia boesemani]|uniref:protein FAM180A n=1 Tax=Melanotaenia boesemani TaxID=1250792 RepID=UPI001C03AD7F|nr:protein FAM180A [Melanotaenia boesemani]
MSEGTNQRRMRLQQKICLQIILWLWFDNILQDVSGGTRSKTTSSVDVNLMFEFLLGGVVIDQDSNVLLLDKEMASMRQGREFLSQINDDIPKSLSSMSLMVSTLEARQKTRLTQSEFDNLVLSMVYSAHQAQKSRDKREAWGGMLLQLANITVYELRGSFLFSS